MRINGMAMAACLGAFVLAGQASAEDKPYGVGFATVGQDVKEIQEAAKSDGRKLFCDADKDQEIGKGDLEVMRVSEVQAAAGVTRCAVFGKGEDGTWINRQVGVAGQPSQFWMLALEDGGVHRVMQIQVFQPKEAWESTSKALTQEFGSPTKAGSTSSSWRNSMSELVMTRGSDGFYIYYSDLRLQQLMRERLGIAKNAKQ